MINTGSIFFGRGANPSGGGSGSVETVTGNNGIYVNNTDPLNPVVQFGGSLGTSQAVTAELGSNREIVMPSNVIFFSLDGAFVNGDTRIAAIIPSDPFLVPNLGGFHVEENITTFGASQRKGYSLFAVDSYNTMVWLRRSANDGFYFGTSYGNEVASGVQNGISFFDSVEADGNHISVGLFDTDVDDGLFFQVKGTMSLHNINPISPPTESELAGLAIDQSTNQVQGANVENGLSLSAAGGVASYVLGNDVGDALNPAQLSSERQILTNGFPLTLTDLAGNYFHYGNGSIIGMNTAGYLMNLAPDHINFNDPAGDLESYLDWENLLLSDNTGNENIQTSTSIQIYNILNPTNYTLLENNNLRMQDGVDYAMTLEDDGVDFENISTDDYGMLGSTELQFSNGIAGGGAVLQKNYLAVNAPAAVGTFGVADFWGGGITTDDPSSPGSQGSIWELGTLLTGGAYTLDSTSAAVVSIGGVLRRVALLN